MLEHWFVNDLTVATVTRDSYGDLTPATQVSVKGLIRDNMTIVLNDSKEETETNAIAWLPLGTVVNQGDIIREGSDNYRVIKVVRAKRGGSNDTCFVKCYLQVSSVGGIS